MQKSFNYLLRFVLMTMAEWVHGLQIQSFCHFFIFNGSNCQLFTLLQLLVHVGSKLFNYSKPFTTTSSAGRRGGWERRYKVQTGNSYLFLFYLYRVTVKTINKFDQHFATIIVVKSHWSFFYSGDNIFDNTRIGLFTTPYFYCLMC